MPDLYLDDLEPGQVFELGTCRLDAESIMAFARAYDPQPFHTDEALAQRSIYGGLIASGWQTVCVFMRLFAEGLLHRAAAMGSPGVDEVRWLKPVRPGDDLHARVAVMEVRPSRSRPDRGIARLRCSMAGPAGDEVMTFIANVLFERRPERPA